MEGTLPGARHNMDLVDDVSRFASYTYAHRNKAEATVLIRKLLPGFG